MPTQATSSSHDVVIFGGGAAGLWLLDELVRAGRHPVLLEAHELGFSQTVASQGIIHGGLKYTLKGLFTRSAQAIKQMPTVWRECLESKREPALGATKLRSGYVYLWQTESIGSRFGMLGAKSLLTIKPVALGAEERPALLAGSTGTVYRLDEPVIDPRSFVADLAGRQHDRIIKIDSEGGLTFDTDGPGRVRAIHLRNPETQGALELRPGSVVFTAGGGNAGLREMVGLSGRAMQRRPLHMAVARGGLPVFHGHCVDGNKTRVTITSAIDDAGEAVWQIGGQVAEDGVDMDAKALIGHVQSELTATMGAIDLGSTQWSTYRIDRAEAANDTGVRPDDVQIMTEGNVITAWPTKLALAPVLAAQILGELKSPPPPTASPDEMDRAMLNDWPRPGVAKPPWEVNAQWS